MKLNSQDTRTMQRFAVRTPEKNVLDILGQGFQTLGLTSDNQRLVNVFFSCSEAISRKS